MTPADFTNWMRGFMAALGGAPMTAAQAETVRQELAKVTTPYPWTLTVLPVQPYQQPTYPSWPQPWITCDTGVRYGNAGALKTVGGAGVAMLGGAGAPNPSFGVFTGFANAAAAAPTPSFTINLTDTQS